MSAKEFLQKFLEEEPPYKKVTITAEQLLEFADIKILTINHFCNRCNKLRTFKSQMEPLKVIKNEYGAFSISQYNNIESNIANFFLARYSSCFLLKFYCQHDCGESHYVSLLISNGTIQKIGQYPTFTKEEVNNKLIQYKSLISEYYPELTKAVSAYSQNMGVAAFVYLRRILEHLIEDKYEKFVGTAEGIKFVDKLREVEKYEQVIPNDFDEIKNQIYSVLSKGVHEYEESECLTLFRAVQYIIESILDEELLRREKARKAQEAKKVIQDKLKERDKKDDVQK